MIQNFLHIHDDTHSQNHDTNTLIFPGQKLRIYVKLNLATDKTEKALGKKCRNENFKL